MAHPRNSDLLGLHGNLQQRVRMLEIRGGVFLDTHNFIVSGSVTSGVYIPPAYVAVGDHAITFTNFGALCRTGSVSVDVVVLRDGTMYASPYDLDLQDGDLVRAIVNSASSVTDLTVWYSLTKRTA